MKAIQIHQFGEAEVLKLEEINDLKPAIGQVKIRHVMIGINFADIYQRRGIAYTKELPFTPGQEAAGIVEEVGEGVTLVKPGDRVAYAGQIGAYAEFNLVAEEKLIPLPKELTFEQGATFPLQGMTAHYLLHEFKELDKSDTVLIHAAAGGVGLLLVQWAKHIGATVIGTVSTEEKAQEALQAGADHVILYTEQDFVEEVHRLTDGLGADLIIDGVGKTTFKGDLEAASVRGHIISYGNASGPPEPVALSDLKKRSLTLSSCTLPHFLKTREELLFRANAVMEGIQRGWLKLKIDRILPLEQAEKAHSLLESRSTSGKLLLAPFHNQ